MTNQNRAKAIFKELSINSYSKEASAKGYQQRIDFLESKRNLSLDHITGKGDLPTPESLKGNIENFIGFAQIPIGLAGPLLINGKHANGEFQIPLATTEGALVASYNRGMKACRLSGGVTSICIKEGVQRSPYFKFENILVVQYFLKWIERSKVYIQAIVPKCSRYAKLVNLSTNVEGNSVILTLEYTTGDAAGQNMVTICTDQICKFILSNFEIEPTEWYVEGNYSGDKKATALSFANVRGKKVVAEVVIPKEIVKETLKTTPKKIAQSLQASTLAAIQSGAIGSQAHVANGLTALFIACGQDVACISEASVGLTRMEVNAAGDLYVSVTLPALIVGTVGGGTGLSTQKECLEILDCAGSGKAKKFAEICGAVALAGELSIASAMAANHFTQAHQRLGRKK